MMRLFLMMFALTMGLFSPSAAEARRSGGAIQSGTDLRFVAETTIPGITGDSQTIAVCHLVEYAALLFVPIYTTTKGYALSPDGCTGDSYRDLSAEHLGDLQAAGMVDPALPADPKASFKDLVWGHAWIIVGAIGLLFQLAIWLRSRPQGRKRSKTSDTLAIHSLVAMSQVAVADGHIDQRELKQISSILTRLTGQGYSMQQVSDLLTRINPSPNDLAKVGLDLSDADRQIVLEAALNIAVADGEIHPHEYAVVSDLAQRMMIGADQFRNALNRISAHMHATNPA